MHASRLTAPNGGGSPRRGIGVGPEPAVDPGDDVGDDLVAAEFVERLVAHAGEEEEGRVGGSAERELAAVGVAEHEPGQPGARAAGLVERGDQVRSQLVVSPDDTPTARAPAVAAEVDREQVNPGRRDDGPRDVFVSAAVL